MGGKELNGFEYLFIGLVIGFGCYYGVLFYIFRHDIKKYVKECMKQ